MPPNTRKPFAVAEAFPDGTWYTDVSRFYKLTHSHLSRLEHLVKEANAQWPKPLGESLKDHEIPSTLNALVEERDATSDIARLFAAMTVEAFLNFYGAARLGEGEFNCHFERLGLISKARQLLLICDGLSVSEADPLIASLKRVAESRNALAHPKARKASPGDAPDKLWIPIPGAARLAVEAMDTFFIEVRTLLPESKYFLPL